MRPLTSCKACSELGLLVATGGICLLDAALRHSAADAVPLHLARHHACVFHHGDNFALCSLPIVSHTHIPTLQLICIQCSELTSILSVLFATTNSRQKCCIQLAVVGITHSDGCCYGLCGELQARGAFCHAACRNSVSLGHVAVAGQSRHQLNQTRLPFCCPDIWLCGCPAGSLSGLFCCPFCSAIKVWTRRCVHVNSISGLPSTRILSLEFYLTCLSP